MAIEVVTPRAEAPPRPASLSARIVAAPTWLVLGSLISLSSVARFLGGLRHTVPLLLPDEYIYPSIARSIAEHGKPWIRDAPAHFPALLEPILTAPFYLQHDAVLAFRLTQALHAVEMSLAAIPIYLIARRLGARKTLAYAAAVATLTFQDLLYSASMLAEAVSYPLALWVVYAAMRVLERPSRRHQLLFVLAAGLTVFARVQYATLPLVLAFAALIVERGRVVRALRHVWLAVACFCAPPALLFALVGAKKLLGPYSTASSSLHPGALAHWSWTELTLLAYAAGLVIVPGALVGLAGALVRPRLRAELAFAAMFVSIAGALLLESAYISDTSSHRFEERYLAILLPLIVVAFVVYVERGLQHARAVALIAVGLLLLAARVPLSGFAVTHRNDESPTLYAVNWLEHLFGVGNAGLAIALLAAGLSITAALIGWRRRGAFVALALVLVLGTVSSAFASVWDAGHARDLRHAILPADFQWLDHTGAKDVTLLQTPYSRNGLLIETMFWNREIRHLVRFGSGPIDAFHAPATTIAKDGRILENGHTVHGPLLVETYGSTVVMRGAGKPLDAPGFKLYRTRAVPRMAMLTAGRYFDGWLAPSGAITIWPKNGHSLRGRLELTLFMPRHSQVTTLEMRAPGIRASVAVKPNHFARISLPVSSCRWWTLSFATPNPGYYDLRDVGPWSKPPVFVPAAHAPACK